MSQIFVGIDPGVHACGIACVRDGKLVAAGYVKESAHQENDIAQAVRWAVHEVTHPVRLRDDWPVVGIEFPRTVQGRARGQADANDLIALAYEIGRMEMAIDEAKVLRVRVDSWKGNVSTDVIEARLHGKPPLGLTPEEWAGVKLPAPSYQHNVWDAIALAKWLAAWPARNPSKTLASLNIL